MLKAHETKEEKGSNTYKLRLTDRLHLRLVVSILNKQNKIKPMIPKLSK